MSLSDEQCDAVIAEAAGLADPIANKTTECRAWRVTRHSFTHSLIQSLMVDKLDAQVVRYAVGGSYDWHTDGPTRESTMVVQLSDPADYDGCVLEIEAEGELITASRDRGTIMTFPASWTHRSTPVERGERWALVIWVPK